MLANTARRSVSRTLASGAFRTTRALSDDPAGLRKTLGEKIPEWQSEIKTFCKEHGHKSLGETTVNHAYQGMRDLKAMVWETSLLDSQEGIRFRGHSIPELQDVLPKAPGGEEPLPESLLYLLLTDEIPTESQVRELSTSLNERAVLSDYTKKIIEEFPKDMHPMTQFSTAIMSMQRESQFQQKYSSGSLRKADYWVHTLEDSLNVIAKAPIAAAAIYRNTFHGGTDMWAPVDKSLDISANFSNALGSQFGGNDTFREMMRLYLTIHADHEGGNVSAHTVHLVGSALSDPYLSLAAGLNGLAGPLHGLANQECLKFQKMIMAKLGSPPYSAEDVRKATWDILNAGQVVPGFGHAVLRKTDPRYMVQREFATKHFPDDALFQLVNRQFEVVPEVLKEHGKTKNPYPNVDAHSGCLLQHFGLKEENYYTVLFGVSRAIGTLSQLVLDRALGFPLERPKSLTTKWLKQNVQ